MSSATEIRALPEAPGYRARRTLPLRVEAMRQLRRRRTLLMGGVLAALPFILVIAFAIGGTPGGGEGGGGGSRINLMDVATESAANFAATCLFVSMRLPAGRTGGPLLRGHRGLRGELVLASLPPRGPGAPLAAAVEQARRGPRLQPGRDGAAAARRPRRGGGGLRLGAAEAAHRGALTTADTVPRLALVVAFVFVSQLVTAGLAFWLSTKTDAPLGAVGGAVGLTIVGNVLDAVTALGTWREFLPAHWQFAWADALQPDLEWGGMAKGAAVSITYALILFALAFRGFSRKDIVS